MKKLMALMLVLLATSVGAQTECEKGPDTKSCFYDFSVDAGSGFPDWEGDLGINLAKVQDDAGKMLIRAGSADVYEGNHAHLLWTEAGGGFDWARTTYGFTGDAGLAGWYPKLSDGQIYCDPVGHAPRASDELISLTLFDDGESYIGGVLGGDLRPLGFTIPPNGDVPPHGYAVVGVVQKVAGESAPRLLAWTLGPPILMGNVNKHLTVSAYEDANGWNVKAKGDELFDGRQWEAHAVIEGEPNFEAGVGLDAIVLPQTPCLPELQRVFTVLEIEARYP